MTLGFHPQFVEPILECLKDVNAYKGKLHSMREDLRWTSKYDIHFVTGNRSKERKEFARAKCYAVETFEMTFNLITGFKIFIGYVELSAPTMQLLSKNDGFYSLAEFEKWFLPKVIKRNGKLSGKIIHWTPFTYADHLIKLNQ